MARAGTPFVNRLADETSPYLLQHAHNPVDWYPWGPEAFERALREDKPIFLSVGYSTCYWCHVMERQCFENEVIAAEMNRRFVNIKVDREERPDVDQLYMLALQIMTRQGGWPMSVFLLPDLRPFYAGTYFPPEEGHGRMGFPRLLAAIDDAFHHRLADVNESADRLVKILVELSEPAPPASSPRIDSAWINGIINRSTDDFDPDNGGFGSAPKFPRQTLLELLLTRQSDQPDPSIQTMIRATLDAMARGGIRDHLGGAFHRYSTDAQWLIPHFEIMLYDNAMLLWIYAEAYRQLGDPRYAVIARGIADFVLLEMTSPAGAFYTALDAEVDAQEGASYLWTRDQVVETLRGAFSADHIARFCRVYGLDQGPNFRDPHGESDVPDRNVLFLSDPGPADKPALLDADLRAMCRALYAARRQRKQPSLDDKILTSWNGLMIRALAFAGRMLEEDRYGQAAHRAADFLMANHRGADGGLLRVSKDGRAKFPAFLDDYAFFIQAILELGQAGGGTNRREQATELAEQMKSRFAGGNVGGYFFSQASAADLIVRQKVGSDSPLPSGNGVAALVLLRLGDVEAAARTLGAFVGPMQSIGDGASALVLAAMIYVRQHGPLEIVPTTVSNLERPPSPQELAQSAVRMSADWIDSSRLNVRCRVRDGYHLNASQAEGSIIPTRLMIEGFSPEQVTIEYPVPVNRQFAFSDKPMPVFEEEFVIEARFKAPRSASQPIRLVLSYQACDETTCLAPAVQRLVVN